jgi:hypothetical protein
LQKSPKFFGHFFPKYTLWVNFGKIRVGLHFRHFFTNSSGHPGATLRCWLPKCRENEDTLPHSQPQIFGDSQVIFG